MIGGKFAPLLRGCRHGFSDCHLQYSSDWNSQWDLWQTLSVKSKKKDLGHCGNSKSVREKERPSKEKIRTWRTGEIQGSEQQHQEVPEKGKRKLDSWTVWWDWRKFLGRTTVTGHTNKWNTWPLWKKEKLQLSKIVHKNVSQNNKRY